MSVQKSLFCHTSSDLLGSIASFGEPDALAIMSSLSRDIRKKLDPSNAKTLTFWSTVVRNSTHLICQTFLANRNLSDMTSVQKWVEIYRDAKNTDRGIDKGVVTKEREFDSISLEKECAIKAISVSQQWVLVIGGNREVQNLFLFRKETGKLENSSNSFESFVVRIKIISENIFITMAKYSLSIWDLKTLSMRKTIAYSNQGANPEQSFALYKQFVIFPVHHRKGNELLCYDLENNTTSIIPISKPKSQIGSVVISGTTLYASFENQVCKIDFSKLTLDNNKEHSAIEFEEVTKVPGSRIMSIHPIGKELHILSGYRVKRSHSPFRFYSVFNGEKSVKIKYLDKHVDLQLYAPWVFSLENANHGYLTREGKHRLTEMSICLRSGFVASMDMNSLSAYSLDRANGRIYVAGFCDQKLARIVSYRFGT